MNLFFRDTRFHAQKCVSRHKTFQISRKTFRDTEKNLGNRVSRTFIFTVRFSGLSDSGR